MKEEKYVIYEKSKIDEYLREFFGGIYTRSEIEELQESSLLMEEWAKDECFTKFIGGMEEWAKDEEAAGSPEKLSCDWYHGTWQYMRLLNMVAVPRWYSFYKDALSTVLRQKPNANVMISACADYGMLHTLDYSVRAVGAHPNIVVYDICNTPLKSSQWYANRHNLAITCICDNIITANIEDSSFDLVVTDEFLTVLKAPCKPMIIEKWKKILKPGGTVVTTAMIGKPTRQELRDRYAERAGNLFATYGNVMFPEHSSSEEKKQKLLRQFHQFAMFHTRHMIKDEKEIRNLFKDFKYLSIIPLTTLGECVNPTDSFQISARLEE
ncbi:MAG: class I SAM-dependent methyltransferase [Candidatus Aminicenantes bacterium]|nr:MAG: class I SAM-dependent methyltransferase [Candidatus Aminicenantes bacterium]